MPFLCWTLTCVERFSQNQLTVSSRLKAFVLVLAMLSAAVAPAAASCLVETASGAAMECCAKTTPCRTPVLQKACCPCSPDSTSTAPAGTPVAPAPAPLVSFAHVTVAPPSHQGPVSLRVGMAFASTLLDTGQDPPWLLNASLLI